MVLSCKKATELIEKKSFIKLNPREKIQLSLHKSLCDACTAYEKQSKKIDELLQKTPDESINDSTILKNEWLKEKIMNEIPKS